MSPNVRWVVGILLALVIGLAVGLAIVAGDDSSDDSETVTQETETEETETVETEAAPTVTTVPDAGGVSPPPSGKPDGTGGLGAE